MRFLIAALFLLACGSIRAESALLEQVFGEADVESISLGDAGEFYAAIRQRDGRQVLEARLVLGNVTHFELVPDAGRIVSFRLLPQRRLAWVLRTGEGSKAHDALWLLHLSSRKQREVLTADRVRFTDLVPADQFGFEVLVDSLGRRPGTELRRIEFEKGKGKSIARLNGTCDLINDPAGNLRYADCVDVRNREGHVHLRRSDDSRTWSPMKASGLDSAQKLVGTFADGSLMALELPADGGSRIVRIRDGVTEEISASQSRQPTSWLRSLDGRSMIGALWLTGDPSSEIFDPAHPDSSRYLQWSLQHSGALLQMHGRSFDQRLTLVSVTLPDQPTRYEMWHRDRQSTPVVIGRSAIGAYVPTGLKREARQVSLNDEHLRDAFVTPGLKPRKQLAVILSADPPKWGFSPFVATLAELGYDVVEFDSPAHEAGDQAKSLVSALKWARNLGWGGDRPACLLAAPEVLEATKPILFALATECLVALPAGQLPVTATTAAPFIDQITQLEPVEIRP